MNPKIRYALVALAAAIILAVIITTVTILIEASLVKGVLVAPTASNDITGQTETHGNYLYLFPCFS